MSGLLRICRLYGAMRVTDRYGQSARYVYDYAADEAVPESEMPFGGERWKRSERAKWAAMGAAIDKGAPNL